MYRRSAQRGDRGDKAIRDILVRILAPEVYQYHFSGGNAARLYDFGDRFVIHLISPLSFFFFRLGTGVTRTRISITARVSSRFSMSSM